MSIPEVFFRETIDLNRYSNAVAIKYVVNYNQIILNAAKQLRQIDQRQVAEIAKGGARIIAPQTRKRLRAIIKQSKDSLDTWWLRSAIDMGSEMQGVAMLQSEFIQNELKKVTASGNVPINSVAISDKYAESVIMTDPSEVNIFTDKAFTEDNFKQFGSGKFRLTAQQGASITLPNGNTVEKAFRGIAESSAQKLDLAVRSGVFSGETLEQISRRLIGRLEFSQKGNVKQIALAGGELTKLANHQIQTIVRTSVNQVANQASQAVYAANKKVAPKYEYVATLDSRTSAICQRLDGQTFDYNNGPTPPQHFNCRSTTVPVVDFDGLQKKYPNLEKPPTTQFDTRPSATGRVPQGTTYGNWLLNQDRKLQVKTLGSEGKVRIFKKLAKKEGSGQAALRKMIRNDGTEVSLAKLQQLYGKPTVAKRKPTVAPPKPKAVVGAAVASDFVKSKPLKKLSDKEMLKNLEEYRKHAKRQFEVFGEGGYGDTDDMIDNLKQGLKATDPKRNLYTNLEYVYWRQGFNKKPKLVNSVKDLQDSKELLKGADGENLIMFRGVTRKNYTDQFKGTGKNGDVHFGGEGIYGRGTYSAARSSHGTKAVMNKANKEALELAESYGKDYAADKFPENLLDERITAFGLRKDAKIKTWKKGSTLKEEGGLDKFTARPNSKFYETEYKAWEKATIEEAEKLTGLNFKDVGAANAALGVDAYQVPLPTVFLDDVTKKVTVASMDYWVILNRSAIVVSKSAKL